MMGASALQDFYRSAHLTCRIGPGHFPSAKAIQELGSQQGMRGTHRRKLPQELSEIAYASVDPNPKGGCFRGARAKGGHRTTMAKQFRKARQKADLPASLVLYCARHAFGTAIYEETGNLAMVMKVMGHTDVRTAMRYQHPILDPVRDAIDLRNSRHNPRHSELRVQ
jgi:integrase